MKRSFGGASRPALALGLFAATLLAGPALAAFGQADPWQMGLQDAATPVAEDIRWFHNALLLPIITIISLFVLGLLIYVVANFRASKNKTPSRVTHNTPLEVAWTLIPVLILVVIAIPSFRLLREQVRIPKADLTIKATGYAWYWKFEYAKDSGGPFEFETRMLSDEDRQKAATERKVALSEVPRLLAVDNEVVVPVNKVVHVQVTAGDVIHALAMPSFGIKMDAIPGRLNETWFKATREGIYYGQCSELCGKDHAFMPLAIRVVSEEAYKAWLAEAQKKFASLPPVRQVASHP